MLSAELFKFLIIHTLNFIQIRVNKRNHLLDILLFLGEFISQTENISRIYNEFSEFAGHNIVRKRNKIINRIIPTT